MQLRGGKRVGAADEVADGVTDKVDVAWVDWLCVGIVAGVLALYLAALVGARAATHDG